MSGRVLKTPGRVKVTLPTCRCLTGGREVQNVVVYRFFAGIGELQLDFYWRVVAKLPCVALQQALAEIFLRFEDAPCQHLAIQIAEFKGQVRKGFRPAAGVEQRGFQYQCLWLLGVRVHDEVQRLINRFLTLISAENHLA